MCWSGAPRGATPVRCSPGGDTRATLAELLERRSPVYAEADLTVDSGNGQINVVVERVLEVLGAQRGGARS